MLMNNSEKTNLNFFEKDKVLVIYDGLVDDNGHDSYHLHYVFNRHGHLEEKALKDIFQEHHGDENEGLSLQGGFHTISDLREYCQKLIQHFQVTDVVLLTLETYNNSIESSPDLITLKNSLLDKGETIKNKGQNSARKLFLRKFFN